MSIELVESNGIKAFIGANCDIKNLNPNTMQGVLGDIVCYVSEKLKEAYDSSIPEMKELSIANLISMTLTNIIINTISPRLSSDDLNRRMLVMYRFLDELKEVTLKCFEESETTFDEAIKKTN